MTGAARTVSRPSESILSAVAQKKIHVGLISLVASGLAPASQPCDLWKPLDWASEAICQSV